MDKQYSDYCKDNHEQKNPDTAQYIMYESSHQALKQDSLLLAERLSLGTVVTGRGWEGEVLGTDNVLFFYLVFDNMVCTTCEHLLICILMARTFFSQYVL